MRCVVSPLSLPDAEALGLPLTSSRQPSLHGPAHLTSPHSAWSEQGLQWGKDQEWEEIHLVAECCLSLGFP